MQTAFWSWEFCKYAASISTGERRIIVLFRRRPCLRRRRNARRAHCSHRFRPMTTKRKAGASSGSCCSCSGSSCRRRNAPRCRTSRGCSPSASACRRSRPPRSTQRRARTHKEESARTSPASARAPCPSQGDTAPPGGSFPPSSDRVRTPRPDRDTRAWSSYARA